MMFDIIIPTCSHDVSLLLNEITAYSGHNNIIVSKGLNSASVNRNNGLNLSTSNIIIMADDDLCGFYNGWVDDLVRPLISNENIVFVSARLMKKDFVPGNMVCMNHNIRDEYVDVYHAPTALCAFRNDGTRFCEEYINSGYEDTHFVMDLRYRYGKKSRVVVNNMCKIIHLNEQKGQAEALSHNQAIFNKYWGKHK